MSKCFSLISLCCNGFLTCKSKCKYEEERRCNYICKERDDVKDCINIRRFASSCRVMRKAVRHLPKEEQDGKQVPYDGE